MAAAQLLDAARAALPGLDAQLAAGEFLPLRDWLRANVWALGREPGSFDDVLRVATGGPLDPQVYLQYLQDKYSAVYRLPKP
jgi:carboxypeptidase Taq